MPGTRSSRRRRGPRLAKLAGVVLAVVIVGGGAAGYMTLSGHRQHPSSASQLPSKVISEQTVGLAAIIGGQQGQLAQLLPAAGSAQFTPVPAAMVQSGPGQWNTDLMAGDSYVFIYAPTGSCLTAGGPAAHPALTLAHCDLQASQRWRRSGPAVVSRNHDFYQYSSLADRSCLTVTGAQPGSVWSAGLTPCGGPGTQAQQIAFWWEPSLLTAPGAGGQ